ncbi:MAG: hypothetical protein PHO64_12105, partial [Thiomonas sp.]|nr:hypothetical protein [Thiomonas sp.]
MDRLIDARGRGTGFELRGALRLVEERILPALVGPYPNVHHAVRDPEMAELWIQGWASQILANGLTPVEIDEGLARVGSVLQAHGTPPLSFGHFLEACRPNAHLTGTDQEARKPH